MRPSGPILNISKNHYYHCISVLTRIDGSTELHNEVRILNQTQQPPRVIVWPIYSLLEDYGKILLMA